MEDVRRIAGRDTTAHRLWHISVLLDRSAPSGVASHQWWPHKLGDQQLCWKFCPVSHAVFAVTFPVGDARANAFGSWSGRSELVAARVER